MDKCKLGPVALIETLNQESILASQDGLLAGIELQSRHKNGYLPFSASLSYTGARNPSENSKIEIAIKKSATPHLEASHLATTT